MNRRKFISLASIAGISTTFAQPSINGILADTWARDFVMTVNGKLSSGRLGVTLAHEHIITDFAGAEANPYLPYTDSHAIEKFLPHLRSLKESGVSSFVECTPAYIGRNVKLLKALSKASGINIITNTGYYAAVGQKYLPKHTFSESAEQIAQRWLNEWHNGIEGTGILPGFIKLGVDAGPLKEIEKKLIHAAAITHLGTGLKIFIHTGSAQAAKEELLLLEGKGVVADAMVWVHAQNDSSGDTQVALAKKGCWVSLDGVNEKDGAIETYTAFILRMKKEGLLHKVLLSHDDGFSVETSPQGSQLIPYKNGNSYPYRSLFTKLKPALLEKGITQQEFSQITTKNPAEALKIKICKT